MRLLGHAVLLPSFGRVASLQVAGLAGLVEEGEEFGEVELGGVGV